MKITLQEENVTRRGAHRTTTSQEENLTKQEDDLLGMKREADSKKAGPTRQEKTKLP